MLRLGADAIASHGIEFLEIVANHLRVTGRTLAFVEPCFDNLANIFGRHQIPLVALADELLDTPALGAWRNNVAVDAICIVTPNNPTGRLLSAANLATIVEYCQRRNAILVVDSSFRAYTPRDRIYDQYSMLMILGSTTSLSRTPEDLADDGAKGVGRDETPEQIIRKLREAERMLGEGKTIAEAAKELGISEQTYHRWRNQYGGMKADDAKRLKELERENATLKRIVADKELEVVALKEVAKGNW